TSSEVAVTAGVKVGYCTGVPVTLAEGGNVIGATGFVVVTGGATNFFWGVSERQPLENITTINTRRRNRVRGFIWEFYSGTT
ncbi:MAG: hypothetical protein WCK53_08405, partial [Methanomicrobiales archaeon]